MRIDRQKEDLKMNSAILDKEERIDILKRQLEFRGN